jgi:hypothetical protein
MGHLPRQLRVLVMVMVLVLMLVLLLLVLMLTVVLAPMAMLRELQPSLMGGAGTEARTGVQVARGEGVAVSVVAEVEAVVSVVEAGVATRASVAGALAVVMNEVR